MYRPLLKLLSRGYRRIRQQTQDSDTRGDAAYP